MFFSSTKNIIKLPIIIVTTIAIVFGFFCVDMFRHSPMEMDNINILEVASINSEQTCCGGTISQHIQSWTNTFLITPSHLRDNFALLILILLAVLVFLKSPLPYTLTDQKLIVSKLYLHKRFNFIIFNPLELAFSKGILNPKIY